jgi:PB1 domain
MSSYKFIYLHYSELNLNAFSQYQKVPERGESMSVSGRFDPTSNRKNVANTNSDRKLQTFYMPTQNPQQILNYSFQTGEEFALEFIQERTNSRPQFINKSKNVNQTQIPIISPVGPKRQLSENKIAKMGNEIEIAGTKVLGLDELEKNTSKSVKGTSRMFQEPDNGYNFSKQNVIKFLCSLGGKFLPRPGDGAIRYVGGKTYILKLRKDISWRELSQKTTRLLNKSHIVKYHLPGEEWNVLIVVSCDEDVHHMMEECDILQASEEKPRLFLFSSLDEEEDNEIHSSDTDSEARFVAAVNEATDTGYADVDLGWSSSGNNEISSRGPAGDLDPLIFDMDGDSTNHSNNYSGSSIAISMKKTDMKMHTGAVAQRVRMSFHKNLATNQAYTGRHHGSGKIPVPSSLPSEFMFKNLSKPVHVQKDLKPLDGGSIQFNFKTNEKFDHKNMLLNSGIKETSSDENSSGTISTTPLGYSESRDDITSLNYFSSSSNDQLSTFSRSDNPIESSKKAINDANLVKGDHTESRIRVKEPETSSTTSFYRKQRRLGSHEEINFDEIIGEQNNILRQNTIERSDPKNSIKSKELNTIKWHDDMAISSRELSKESISVEKFLISRPTKLDFKFVGNEKESTVSVSGLSQENKNEITNSVQLGEVVLDYSNISCINEGSSTIQVGQLLDEEIGGSTFSLSENEVPLWSLK